MKSVLLIEWTEEKYTKNTARTTWLVEGLRQLRLWHLQGHYRYISSSSYSSHRKIFPKIARVSLFAVHACLKVYRVVFL